MSNARMVGPGWGCAEESLVARGKRAKHRDADTEAIRAI